MQRSSRSAGMKPLLPAGSHAQPGPSSENHKSLQASDEGMPAEIPHERTSEQFNDAAPPNGREDN